MATQALFSEHWHAVRFLRPRLREGVQPLFRRLRGQTWVLLQDPLTGRFHRLTPQVWRVVALLDGRRTLDEVWAATGAAAADPAAPDEAVITQPQLVQLMGSLYGQDLLQSQVAPDADEVLERWRKQRRTERRQSWLNPMSLKLPLLHPDAWFERHAALARRLCSWPVLLLWAMLVLPSAALAWQHGQALTENLSDRVLSGSNLAVLWLVYPLAKAIHEAAHGMAVKAWGGQVREIGLMFILFTPVPYVDATSSYRFDSKWQRALVAAAGIMAELALGAVALQVWLQAQPGIVSAVAFNVVLIAGFSTFVVNGNPLMRYDGYYVLSDLLEIPNLAHRSTQYWTYLLDRYALGSKDAHPPVGADSERGWLLVFGAISPLYRLSVSIGLIWFIAGQYFWVGMGVAALGAWTSLVMPLWRGWRHLADSPTLARRRGWAIWRIGVLGALLGLGLFAVPAPFYALHQGVLWLPDDALLRAPVHAHVATVASGVHPGDLVQAEQPLVQLDSIVVLAELGSAAADVAQTRAQLRQAEVDDPVRAQSLRAELQGRLAQLAEQQRRADALALRTQLAGRWMPAGATQLPGRFVKRGDLIGVVVPGPAALVRSAVTQEDLDLIAQRARLSAVRAQVRLPEGEVIDATLARAIGGGEQLLVSPALGSSGGGEIAVDPQDSEGTQPLHRVFDLELALAHPPLSLPQAFGNRVLVRFDLGATPLAWQWLLRLRQLFLAQMSL
jgi:putative peptide zinc metalloprotease protein